MGKRQALEPCMICAPAPCECFAPKVKKTAPRPKKRPVAESAPDAKEAVLDPVGVASPPRQDLRAKMKAAAAEAPAIPKWQPQSNRRRGVETEMVKAAPAARPVLSDEQLLLNAALRAIGDIMHPDEQAQYKMIIGSTPTSDEKRAEWKARRKAHVE